MHEFIVPKMGLPQLDICHAFGLGVLLANITKACVSLKDKGQAYLLSVNCDYIPNVGSEIVRSIVGLPSEPIDDQPIRKLPLDWANLDGVLALAFTSPGRRVSSVDQLRQKVEGSDSYLYESLSKAEKILEAMSNSINDNPQWIEDLLSHYEPGQLLKLKLTDREKKCLSMKSSAEPSLGFSTRQPLSNHRAHVKSSLTISAPKYASLLIYMGNIRLLRSQNLSGKMVLFCTPILKTAEIHSESHAPLKTGRDKSPDATLLITGIDWALESTWDIAGLSYQILQRQGAKQSISVGHGYLDLSILRTLYYKGSKNLLFWWRSQLLKQTGCANFKIRLLLQALLKNSALDFEKHLFDIAKNGRDPSISIYFYSISDIQEIIRNMDNSMINSPLAKICTQKSGCMRYAGVLHQLDGGPQNHKASSLRRRLKYINTLEQLLLVLHELSQIAIVCKPLDKLMPVPTRNDLAQLIDEVQEFGAERIAHLIIAAAAVYYPPKEDQINYDDTTDDINQVT